MPRAATTSDPFNAIAEPARRQILELLAAGELSVNTIVERLGMTQPQVSKHLRVLRKVGLVVVRGAGQQRLYTLNGTALKQVHDWIGTFEHLWNQRLDRLEEYLNTTHREKSDGNDK